MFRKELTMKYFSIALLAVLALAFTQAVAQDKSEKPSLTGAKIFIAEMEGGLHSFIAAEIVKKKLPVTVVMDDKEADFILVGASIKADDKWFHTVFGGKDKNEGSVQLLSVKDKTMVWAGEAGDRSLMWGGWRRGGQRKVADRLVNKMKSDLFKK
jgi:hypothetical protein